MIYSNRYVLFLPFPDFLNFVKINKGNFVGNYFDFILVPDVAPIVNVTHNVSSSFMITITEKPPAHELNGVLRFINIRYNISQEQENNYSLRIDHEVFFNSSTPFSFILPNLLAFTVYRMHISYVTVGRGPETNVTMRTLIDSKGLRLLVFYLLTNTKIIRLNSAYSVSSGKPSLSLHPHPFHKADLASFWCLYC